MQSNIEKLYCVKQKIKELEEEKLALEKAIKNDFFEGTETLTDGNYKCKITGKLTVSIDKAKVIEIAEKNNLTDKLEHYFRWKPELDKKNWDSGSKEEKKLLSGAITTKPAKLSFTITKEEKKNEF